MVAILGEDEETEQDNPDPNIYQPEEDEDDELEIDRRIRRVHERLRRLTIVGVPDIDDDDEICETDVEGGWDVGYGVNKRCEAVPSIQSPPPSCVEHLTMLISGISMDCCVSDGVTGSWKTTSSFAVNPATLNHTSFCDPGTLPPCNCDWYQSFDDPSDDTTLHGFADAFCGSEDFSTDTSLNYEVLWVGGTYFIVVSAVDIGANPGAPLMFYAEVGSLSGIINNQLTSCSSVINDFSLDNDYTTVVWGGPTDFTVFGINGTVVIS